jgi:Skp family chaperone for outer membrane proteins
MKSAPLLLIAALALFPLSVAVAAPPPPSSQAGEMRAVEEEIRHLHVKMHGEQDKIEALRAELQGDREKLKGLQERARALRATMRAERRAVRPGKGPGPEGAPQQEGAPGAVE